MCARFCLPCQISPYIMSCRRPAKIEVAPIRAGKGGMTTASAELDLVGDDPLVDEGLVPAPPGLATAPEQVYLPLMMFLLFLSAWKPEQSKSAEVCRLNAPTTWARAGSSTLEKRISVAHDCSVKLTYSVKLPLKSRAPLMLANFSKPLICFNIVLLAIW